MSQVHTRTENSNSGHLDIEFAERVRSGDTDAFSFLFKKYYESLYQFAGRYVRDPQTAENIVQDVFVKIWSNRERLNIQSNVKSYLYRAVTNHALNLLKRERRMTGTKEEFDYRDISIKTPEEELIDREMVAAVHRAIDKLPTQSRRIYLMHRYDDLKYSEIAEILGISINTVKTQMRRALKALHKKLSYLLLSILLLILKRLTI